MPPTTAPVTTLPPTTEPVTTLSPTTAPVSTLPPTTEPVTTLSPTTEPVTTLPPNSQQETTLPLTTQPTVAPTTAKSTQIPIEVVPFREECILEEEIIEVISNLSPEEKSKIGFDMNIVLDCQFAGAACHARFIYIKSQYFNYTDYIMPYVQATFILVLYLLFITNESFIYHL